MPAVESGRRAPVIGIVLNDTILVHIAEAKKEGTAFITPAYTQVVLQKLAVAEDEVEVLILKSGAIIFVDNRIVNPAILIDIEFSVGIHIIGASGPVGDSVTPGVTGPRIVDAIITLSELVL